MECNAKLFGNPGYHLAGGNTQKDRTAISRFISGDDTGSGKCSHAGVEGY
jgi:hypothetical protein